MSFFTTTHHDRANFIFPGNLADCLEPLDRLQTSFGLELRGCVCVEVVS